MFKKILFIFSILFPIFSTAKSIQYTKNNSDLYLATNFLKRAFEDKKNNFVVSPLSVYAATTLLVNGVEGKSKKELVENIFLNSDIDSINKYLRGYMNQTTQFEINNSIWGNDFKDEYQTKMNTVLQADVKPLPENTSVIDDWIREKTSGRIQNLLGNQNTQPKEIFLVNTVYFKDEWLKPFESWATQIQDFHSLDGTLDKVDMMYSHDMMDYYQDDTMQALRLPYKNGDVMQIFLPKEGVDFNEFIRNLRAEDLFLQYHKVPVELHIPRFNLEYKVEDMSQFFGQWGIKTIFNPELANLFGLSNTPHYVAKIIHQANIGLNEKGTEASAATVMEILATSAGPDFSLKRRDWSIPFIANRPFVFMINNGDFIGVYTKGSSQMYAERLAREEKERLEHEQWLKDNPNYIPVGYVIPDVVGEVVSFDPASQKDKIIDKADNQ